MVTAETAVVLPVLVIVLGTCLWAMSVAAAQVRCNDAAYIGARAAARGERVDAIEEAVRSAAPPGAMVHVEKAADRVSVRVQARSLPGRGPLAALPAVTVEGAATAMLEQVLQ
jgi:Flp pilus assembly protein TadG